MNLSQIVQSRWFPSVSSHLLAGLAASGVVLGLRALGITNVVPAEVNAVLSPLIGFLVAAIVHRPGTPGAAPAESGTTVGSQVADMLAADAKAAIDANPELFKNLALGLLTGAKAGSPAPPDPQETGVIK